MENLFRQGVRPGMLVRIALVAPECGISASRPKGDWKVDGKDDFILQAGPVWYVVSEKNSLYTVDDRYQHDSGEPRRTFVSVYSYLTPLSPLEQLAYCADRENPHES